eukprot:gene14790-20840_t
MMLCGSSSAQRRERQSKLAFHTSIVVFLAVGACVQGVRWYQGIDNNEDSGMYVPQDSDLVGRGFQRRLLEQQLMTKEQEIQHLRRQIDRVSMAARVANVKSEAANELIAEMTDDVQSERRKRNKAQLALSEKASMLQQCQGQRDSLATEVNDCGSQIVEITKARYKTSL